MILYGLTQMQLIHRQLLFIVKHADYICTHCCITQTMVKSVLLVLKYRFGLVWFGFDIIAPKNTSQFGL